jgi:hypothetical protein
MMNFIIGAGDLRDHFEDKQKGIRGDKLKNLLKKLIFKTEKTLDVTGINGNR